MSFQVNSTDLKHGTEITESVSTAGQEFKNSTDEKLRKLFTEDVEKLKNSTDEETDRKLVPEDEEEFKKNRTEQSKRKDKDDDDEEQCSGDSAVSYKEKKTWWKRLIQRSCGCGTFSLAINPHLEDKDDDDEDKEISRTQSMDNLFLMQKPQHQSQ